MQTRSGINMSEKNVAKTNETTPAPAKSAEPTAKQVREQENASTRIKLLVKENPKRPGTASHKRFQLYRPGQTVAEFLAAGGTRADLRWDQKHKFIELV
jgi:hypothetical protein